MQSGSKSGFLSRSTGLANIDYDSIFNPSVPKRDGTYTNVLGLGPKPDPGRL
jgi:hypothetical protein